MNTMICWLCLKGKQNPQTGFVQNATGSAMAARSLLHPLLWLFPPHQQQWGHQPWSSWHLRHGLFLCFELVSPWSRACFALGADLLAQLCSRSAAREGWSCCLQDSELELHGSEEQTGESSLGELMAVLDGCHIAFFDNNYKIRALQEVL